MSYPTDVYISHIRRQRDHIKRQAQVLGERTVSSTMQQLELSDMHERLKFKDAELEALRSQLQSMVSALCTIATGW